MADIRKIVIIFVIAVLFSVFVFAMIDAFYPMPDYNDYCKIKSEVPKPYPVLDCKGITASTEEQKACEDRNGYITYSTDSNGCAISYECNTCDYEYRQASKTYDSYLFYISAALALVAIFVGLFLPAKGNTLNEWIGTGFMLGGTFALFYGTARGFMGLGRIIRPIVIGLELVLVIYISYRKIGNLREDKKKKR